MRMSVALDSEITSVYLLYVNSELGSKRVLNCCETIAKIISHHFSREEGVPSLPNVFKPLFDAAKIIEKWFFELDAI